MIRDVVDAAVLDRARVHPRAEHGVAGHLELFARVLRKVAAGFVLDELLVALDDFSQRRLVEASIQLRAARLLHRLELVLERALRDLEDDVAEHLDEAAIAVEREAAVVRPPLQRLDRHVVQTEIQNRVHHAGHRELRAGADRHEQRVLGGTERRAGRLLELLQVLRDLAVDRRGDLLLFLVVDVADLGGDRKTGRHGQARIGHLGEAGAFAAEEVLHVPVAVGLAVAEEVDGLSGFGLATRRRSLSHSMTPVESGNWVIW